MSRWRWSLVKFGFAGAVALVAAAIYGMGMSWWAEPINATGSRPFFGDGLVYVLCRSGRERAG